MCVSSIHTQHTVGKFERVKKENERAMVKLVVMDDMSSVACTY